MSEKRKIIVEIDKDTKDVECALASGEYEWEEYSEAKLGLADELLRAAQLKLEKTIRESVSDYVRQKEKK